jgi:hypothetical protein
MTMSLRRGRKLSRLEVMASREPNSKLLHDKVKRELIYAPETGALSWAPGYGRKGRAGGAAGYQHKTGYRRVSFNGTTYQEHRLIWFWMTGAWPALLIDHRNRVKSDNRWDNLRLATFKDNIINSGLRADSLAVKGVNRDPDFGTYRAVIMVAGVSKTIGSSKCQIAAAYMRLAAEQCLGWESASQTLELIKELENA